jgi:hypothetical protein
LHELREVSGYLDNFVVLSGQEVTTRDFDDVLVYGASVTFPCGVSLSHIRSQAPEAAIVWAHPYRGIKRPGPDKLFAPELDGVEIFNRNHRLSQNIYAYREWTKWGFVATGGTDVHDEIRSIRGLSLAIKNGRCRPFTKRLNCPT